MPSSSATTRSRSPLRLLGPGLLVAATGVGAGDLATGAFSGSVLGTAVLWVVLVGAALKFVLNEGLARWQLATGETLLEGVLRRVPGWARWLFLLYLLPWSWFVGGALVSACGVTAHALLPLLDTPEEGKVVLGIAHSLLGLVLVRRGGFRLFERVMSVCVLFMFVTVLVTAVLLGPDWGAVLRGLFVPSIPHAEGAGLGWTVALMGGVGGTLTVLAYGYWIREEGRDSVQDLAGCRVDLAAGYGVTALFGVAMVLIGSTITVEGRGAGLVVQLANRLEEPLGPAGRWLFLVGAWGAVFSSLLGVWQSVPLLFTDWWNVTCSRRTGEGPAAVDSVPYRGYLLALAIVPLGGLWLGFQSLQKLYAIVGAAFLPLLALVLLAFNSRRSELGELRNRWPSLAALLLALSTFLYLGGLDLLRRFG